MWRESRTEKILAERTSFTFMEAPLGDVCMLLGNKHKISFVTDHEAVADEGVGIDAPVSLAVSEVPLEAALDMIVDQVGLAWTLRGDALWITTEDEIEDLLITKVYDVTDLVVCRDESGQLWDDFENLIEPLIRTLDVESWDDVGGQGSICPASAGASKVLVITQTYQVHRKIAHLLKALRSVAAGKSTDGQP